MFNYFVKKKPKITISEGIVSSTLPMQYGVVMNTPDWEKKKKRKKQLEMINAESGKGYDELNWYRKNGKVLPKGNM